jgi:hypothetical protein
LLHDVEFDIKYIMIWYDNINKFKFCSHIKCEEQIYIVRKHKDQKEKNRQHKDQKNRQHKDQKNRQPKDQKNRQHKDQKEKNRQHKDQKNRQHKDQKEKNIKTNHYTNKLTI